MSSGAHPKGDRQGTTGQGSESAPGRAIVLAELERILSSRIFARSERLKAFLRLLVVEALDGRAEVNEYRIATEIYGRKASFDPQSDSIVRVEAARLRQKLAEYYRSPECTSGPVSIELPPRTFVPVFRDRPASAHDPPPVIARGWFRPRWTFRPLAAVTLILAGMVVIWVVISSSSRLRTLLGLDKQPTATASTISIAVLPFVDLGQAKDEEYFGDGLAEEVMDALGELPGLKVISRTSSFAYRGTAGDIRKIGADLNASLVLEGSIRRQGDRLRITAQLIHTADGYHVWSHTYERSPRDPFAVEQEIARDIAGALRLELVPSREKSGQPHYAPTLENYNVYLLGMHYGHRWSAEGLTKAVGFYEQAVQNDPKFAVAWAELAEARCVLAIHAGYAPRKTMPEAKTAALKALELDDTLADAHASLGLVKGLYEWDWTGAEREFQRAHELDPSNPNVHEAYVMGFLVPTGRLDEALKQTREARAFDPVSTRVSSVLGLVHYYRREYDEALEVLRKTLELDPHFYSAHLAIGSVYEAKSMFRESLDEIRASRPSWESGVGRAFLGYTSARMGKTQDARMLLNELVELSKHRYISPAYIALIHLALGEKVQAFEWLDKAYEQRSASLALLKVNRRYDSVRSDPRFIVLMKKVGLN